MELTHSPEFLLELCHMLAVGDFEIVIGITALINRIGRSGSANGEDRGGAICPLSLPECLQIFHQSLSHVVVPALAIPHSAPTHSSTKLNA